MPAENMESERYLAEYGYLVSISAAKINKFFKVKRVRDYRSRGYKVEEKNNKGIE